MGLNRSSRPGGQFPPKFFRCTRGERSQPYRNLGGIYFEKSLTRLSFLGITRWAYRPKKVLFHAKWAYRPGVNQSRDPRSWDPPPPLHDLPRLTRRLVGGRSQRETWKRSLPIQRLPAPQRRRYCAKPPQRASARTAAWCTGAQPLLADKRRS